MRCNVIGKSLCCLLPVLSLSWFTIMSAGVAGAVTLSGTVSYSGAQGPVSAQRPIHLFIWNTPSPDSDPVAEALVTANGGPFDLELPSGGSYYLAYLLDVQGSGDANVGDPFRVYDNRNNFPGDPITVPQSGVVLTFDDSSMLSGIAGTITYTGSLGMVSFERPLILRRFADPALTTRFQNEDERQVENNGGRYDFLTLDTSTSYLQAFFDVNGNSQLDPGEPYTIYDNRSMPPGDPVTADPSQTAVDFTFADENVQVEMCVGDCNGNGTVTVNEIIALVNIALGTATSSACPNGVSAGQGVTVTLIIQAVNHALGTC